MGTEPITHKLFVFGEFRNMGSDVVVKCHEGCQGERMWAAPGG